MRLTNYLRDAFVRAVMDDVPDIDYRELVQERATANALRLLPPAIQQVWKHAEMRGFIKMDSAYIGGFYLYVPGVSIDATKIEDDDIHAWAKLHDTQSEMRSELESKVRAVAYSCTTREALLKQLPEFQKYLPIDAPKSATLPAIANLVSDLVKAGWPDGGKTVKTEEAAVA